MHVRSVRRARGWRRGRSGAGAVVARPTLNLGGGGISARATAGAGGTALGAPADPEALLQQEQLASLEVSRDVGRSRGDLGEIASRRSR